VDVSLAFGADELAIEVRDDGVGAAAGPAGGHGLAGMRERVLLYGGRLELGQPAGPGFVVRAFLPVGAAT
jgi:signal transduction histidine kinase